MWPVTPSAATESGNEERRGRKSPLLRLIFIETATYWGALHKIGRFRNVPTVGTFINKLKLNLLTNVPTVGTFRKRPILCNAPQGWINLDKIVFITVLHNIDLKVTLHMYVWAGSKQTFNHK